jgi:acyl-CoA synthetase (AMP-forming)/AMP-acid ligase II
MRDYQRMTSAHAFTHTNLFSLLRARCLASPDQLFVISLVQDSEQRFTYGEFVDRVLRARQYLQGRGLVRGDAINLIVQNSAEFLVLYFAALSLGVVVSPINYNFTAREMSYIVRDSRGRMIFVEEEYLPRIEAMRAEAGIQQDVVVLSHKPVAGHARLSDILAGQVLDAGALDAASGDAGIDDPAVIIYTSGTSGNPKGAILTHGNLLADAQAIAEWFAFDRSTRTLCILPLFHNNGQVVTLLAPLWAGGSTVMIKGNISLKTFWDFARRYETTWSSVIPTILSVLLAFKIKRTDHTMKGIICGGALLPRRVQLEFESTFGVPIYEGYGLTETTSFSCFNPLALDRRVIGSIGLPLPVNEMAIQGEDGQKLAPGEIGEICIRGFNVFLEYCNLPERNATAFRGGWFHSGDYGHVDDNGFYYIQGRRDDLIIKGGENIYPREIENVLYGSPKVKDCAVIGVEDRLWGETLAVFVETVEGERMTADEVLAALKNQVADYKLPSKCYFLTDLPDLREIPKGPTKKILRKELKKYYDAHLSDTARQGNAR